MKRVQKLHDRMYINMIYLKLNNIRNLHNRKFLRKQIERCTEVK